jgi:hypothetical protein
MISRVLVIRIGECDKIGECARFCREGATLRRALTQVCLALPPSSGGDAARPAAETAALRDLGRLLQPALKFLHRLSARDLGSGRLNAAAAPMECGGNASAFRFGTRSA